MLAINDERFVKRSEIIWEKGTNRAEFFRGEVHKYGWVDIGSSFLPSDIIAAFLYAQLENLDGIQKKRKEIWNTYFEGLQAPAKKGFFQILQIPKHATNNAHMFYLVCNSPEDRTGLIKHLRENGVHAVFHYLSLQQSDYYEKYKDDRNLPNCNRFTDCLLRLPMYYELSQKELGSISELIHNFYLKEK